MVTKALMTPNYVYTTAASYIETQKSSLSGAASIAPQNSDYRCADRWGAIGAQSGPPETPNVSGHRQSEYPGIKKGGRGVRRAARPEKELLFARAAQPG